MRRVLRVLISLSLLASAHAAASLPTRLPLELGGNLTLQRGVGEPDFSPHKAYRCVLGRVGQVALLVCFVNLLEPLKSLERTLIPSHTV